MKITVKLKSSASVNITVGEVFYFKKSDSGELSDCQIDAIYEGQNVGFIAESAKTLAPGTVSVRDIYNDVPDEFEGVLVDVSKEVGKTTRILYIVEVDVKGNAQSTMNTSGDKIFTLKISGGSKQFPAKTKVIQDYQNGQKIFLNMSLDADNNIVAKDNTGTLAGKCSEKETSETSTLAEIDILKEILRSTELDAKVSNVKGQGGYFVSVSVSEELLNNAEKEATKKAIATTKEVVLKKGYSEELLNSVEAYLLDNGFTADDVKAVFDTYMDYSEYDMLNSHGETYNPVKSRIPEMPKHLYIDTEENQLLLSGYSALINNYNVLCCGEKGTGKNVYVETFAWLLQRPLYSISVNRETDKYDLIGSKTMDAVEENGVVTQKVVFQKEVLIEAMEVGGIINIDEINFADAGVTGLLHSIGDDRRAVEVPSYGYVKAKDNFAIMATMNLDYQGTNQLNEALADRFVNIDFPNNDSILPTLELNCKGVEMGNLKKADKIYQSMMSVIRDGGAELDDKCITIRGFIQAVNMSPIIGIKKALKTAVAGKITDRDYKKFVLDLIDSTIK